MRTRAAVVWDKGSPFDIVHIDVADPARDEVLVRVAACGICPIDLNVRDQLYPPGPPAVLGHEGSGVVESVGPEVTAVRPGDHVVLTYSSCRRCANCISGVPAYCLDFFARNLSGLLPDGSPVVTDGGSVVNASFFGQSSMATHALVRQDSLVVVPADVPLEALAPLGCGVQAGAGAVLATLRPVAGDSIAIFGAGTAGLAAVMAAHAVGCSTIVAVDHRRHRLDLARELGATHIIHGAESDLAALVTDITDGGAQHVVETTGEPLALRNAVESLAVRGTCAVTGASATGTAATLDMSHLLWGRGIRGVMGGDSVPQTLVPRLLELRRHGLFPVDRLIDVYPFDAVNEAVADVESGAAVQPVLVMR
jgi:aryl-alcohol dehydrogenase